MSEEDLKIAFERARHITNEKERSLELSRLRDEGNRRLSNPDLYSNVYSDFLKKLNGVHTTGHTYVEVAIGPASPNFGVEVQRYYRDGKAIYDFTLTSLIDKSVTEKRSVLNFDEPSAKIIIDALISLNNKPKLKTSTIQGKDKPVSKENSNVID